MRQMLQSNHFKATPHKHFWKMVNIYKQDVADFSHQRWDILEHDLNSSQSEQIFANIK